MVTGYIIYSFNNIQLYTDYTMYTGHNRKQARTVTSPDTGPTLLDGAIQQWL